MADAPRGEKSLLVNASFSALGRILGVATVLGSTALTTRALGSVRFGEYSLVLAFVTVFYVLADFGLGQLFVREISRPNHERVASAGEIFTLRLLLLLILLASAPLVALLLPYSRTVVLGTGVAAVGFFFLSFSHLLTGVFQRELAMGSVALAEWLGRLVQLAVTAAVVYGAYQNAVGQNSAATLFFLTAFTAGALAQFLILFVRSRKYVPISLAFGWAKSRALLAEAFPLGVSLIFVYIYFRTDTLILWLYHPGSPVGFYSLAYKVLENLIFFPAAFVGLVFPRLAETWFVDTARFRTLFSRTLRLLVLSAPGAAIGTFALAPWIVGILGGDSFAPAVTPLRVLSLAVLTIFLATLPGQAVVAIGAQKKALWIYGAGAALNVALNLVFIPRYSFMAAAWTTVITEAMVTGGLYWIVWQCMKNPNDAHPLGRLRRPPGSPHKIGNQFYGKIQMSNQAQSPKSKPF